MAVLIGESVCTDLLGIEMPPNSFPSFYNFYKVSAS